MQHAGERLGILGLSIDASGDLHQVDVHAKLPRIAFQMPHREESENGTVTAIIPTYRRPQLLARAITSVARQSFSDVRISVFDNASDDGTADTVRAMALSDPRISYFCHERNMGALRNFEFGLRSVNTPFFSFLSDDDLLLPGFYERALAEFSRNPGALFVVGDTLELLVRGEVLVGSRSAAYHVGYCNAPQGLPLFVEKGIPMWTGILFRREVIDRVGGLDVSSIAGDADFLLRCAAACDFSVFHEPVAIFCHSEEAASHSFDIDSERQLHSKLARKVAELANRAGLGEETLISAWNRAVEQLAARASLKDFAFGKRERVAGRLDTLARHRSPGLMLAALRFIVAATSLWPASRMAVLLARGIRRTRYETLRIRNRELTSRYRPLMRDLATSAQYHDAPRDLAGSGGTYGGDT